MKIALVSDVFGEQNNGTTITARRLVENLRKRGHEVTVVSAFDGGEGYLTLPKRRFLAFNKYIKNKNGVDFADVDEMTLRKVIAENDVIHFLVPFKVCRKGVKIALELHKPFTTAFHCQPENITSHIFLQNSRLVNNAIYKSFRNNYYKRTHFIHCPSQFIAQQLEKNNYDADLRVISNGVIDTFAAKQTDKPDNLADKFCILFVGRYSREKRHDLLIKAVTKSKYADKIQLIFAGSGPLEDKLKRLGTKLKNPPLMRLFTKEELAETINYCDLYVHPSDVEIEAISCIEAFSCGLVPVISDSKKSATKQFALTENNLFRQGDAQSLAEKIDFWLENPEKKSELSNQYIDYGKNFCIGSCVDKMEKMLYDAVDYYTEYYANLPPKKYEKKIVYPQNPTDHVIQMKHRKGAKPINEDYKFENNGLLYQTGATALRGVALLALPTYARVSTKYRIVGRENLRKVKHTGAILMANHVHPLDAAIICTCLDPLRKIRYVILKENVDIPVAGPIIKALGGIPLADTYRGMRSFNHTIEGLLNKKKLVLFFPEASLWPEYTGVRPFHKGGFLYAQKNNVPILPMIYTFRTRKNGKKQIVLNVGEPIYPEGRNAQELCQLTETKFVEYTKQFYNLYR